MSFLLFCQIFKEIFFVVVLSLQSTLEIGRLVEVRVDVDDNDDDNDERSTVAVVSADDVTRVDIDDSRRNLRNICEHNEIPNRISGASAVSGWLDVFEVNQMVLLEPLRRSGACVET